MSALSPSVLALGGCGRCAGASVARLSVSRSGFGRIAFVFPSAVWAGRFAAVLSGFAWVWLVASVRCRGPVVVVALWGVHSPVSSPAVSLAGPSRRPSWCGSAPALVPVPTWGAVSVGRWSPVAFFLRGLGFVRSSHVGSCWSLPAGTPSPVRRLAAARAGVRLFGFSAGPCRPFLASCPWSLWELVLLASA